MMILIVNFFKQAFDIEYNTPIELLYLGGAILLVAAALFVSHNIVFRGHASPATHDKEAKSETTSV
jgi:hypothetical protein